MLKIISTSLLFLITTASFGCGGGPANNAAANTNSNTNPAVVVNSANMPPGFSTSPLPPSTNTTPGIPANAVVLPKGGTPTPGIPSEADLKKPLKPGATPTPGIPSPAEIRRQLNKRVNMSEVNLPPANANPTMMMNNRKLHPGKPQ